MEGFRDIGKTKRAEFDPTPIATPAELNKGILDAGCLEPNRIINYYLYKLLET